MKVLIDGIEFVEKSTNTNAGDGNAGDWNSGRWNSGDWNSGDGNSGRWNAGDGNSGDGNSGRWNSGRWNSGRWNSGDWNSGDGNSGRWNSGRWNAGDWNSGRWNSGDWNSGDFNTTKPPLRLFNKEVKKSVDISQIYYPSWLFFSITEWVDSEKMTAEEKITNPHYEIYGGYLKKYDYKEAAQKSYNKATKEEQRAIEDLPNYNADILFEIFGIDRR